MMDDPKTAVISPLQNHTLNNRMEHFYNHTINARAANEIAIYSKNTQVVGE